MSLISGIRGFSVSMYGQSGVVMDWFGLNDPFTQQVPLKITNAYSGTLWFQSQLVNPRSGYYNYSGIQIGNVNSGASATLVATWDAGVSGWITGSSPITDTLTLNLTTFTSSNYTGSYSSGNFTVFNTLFNRYSGVIKVFGDIYSNDQPTPSVGTAGAGTGTLVNAQSYSYAISYILSGWESDIGASANQAPISGALAVSWSSITGVTQYFVWRWSGTSDFTLYSGNATPDAWLRLMDLLSVSTTTSYTDDGTSPVRTGMFRHRTWQNYTTSGTAAGQQATTDGATYLSAPQSRLPANPGSAHRRIHSFQIGRNSSGTALLGPFYGTIHHRQVAQSGAAVFALAISTNNEASASGQTIADFDALTNRAAATWYRHSIMLGSSGSISSSGLVHIQIPSTGQTGANVDDIFICAVS